MILYNYINSKFYTAKNVNNYFKKFKINYFYKLINNNKY